MADEDWEDWGDDNDNNNNNNNSDNISTTHISSSLQNSILMDDYDDDDIDIGSSGGLDMRYVSKEKKVLSVLESLRQFQNDLADSHVFDTVNYRLARNKYESFIQYYMANAKLAQYTIDTELKRMKFTVIYRAEQFNTEDEIVDVFEQNPMHDLWRLGNQSIYADLLQGLQQQFFKNDLCISVVSTESSFKIDLDKNYLQTRSTFRIMTMTDSMDSPTSQSTNSSGTLELASVTGEVFVDLQHRKLVQCVKDPVLKMVFDADLRNAAIAIANQQENDMNSSANRSTIKESIVESISDIRARLIAKSAAAAPSREKLTETVKVVKKAGGSLLSGMLEGVVWGIGSIVGARNDEEISFRPAPERTTQVPVDEEPCTNRVLSIPKYAESVLTKDPPDESNPKTSPGTVAKLSEEENEDDDWNWDEDDSAQVSANQMPKELQSVSRSGALIAPLKFGTKLAESVVLSFGKWIGAESNDADTEDLQLYRRDEPIVPLKQTSGSPEGTRKLESDGPVSLPHVASSLDRGEPAESVGPWQDENIAVGAVDGIPHPQTLETPLGNPNMDYNQCSIDNNIEKVTTEIADINLLPPTPATIVGDRVASENHIVESSSSIQPNPDPVAPVDSDSHVIIETNVAEQGTPVIIQEIEEVHPNFGCNQDSQLSLAVPENNNPLSTAAASTVVIDLPSSLPAPCESNSSCAEVPVQSTANGKVATTPIAVESQQVPVKLRTRGGKVTK